jgi:hypothetical protein
VLRNTALEAASQPSEFPVLGTADHTAIGYSGFAGYNTRGGIWCWVWKPIFPTLRIAQRAKFTDRAEWGGRRHRQQLHHNTCRQRLVGECQLRLDTNACRLDRGQFHAVRVCRFRLGVGQYRPSASTRPAQILPSAPPPAGILPCSTASRSAAASDVALTPNFFVRAEYEYDRFALIFSIPIAIGSARLGAGFKF